LIAAGRCQISVIVAVDNDGLESTVTAAKHVTGDNGLGPIQERHSRFEISGKYIGAGIHSLWPTTDLPTPPVLAMQTAIAGDGIYTWGNKIGCWDCRYNVLGLLPLKETKKSTYRYKCKVTLIAVLDSHDCDNNGGSEQKKR
jgi:hypothetical protein